jgi:hypothetical protein
MNLKRTCSILIFIVLIGIVQAVDLSLSPSSIQVAPGEEFDVNVTITDVTELYSFQFDFSFDSSVLQYVSVTQGPFLKSDGAGTFELPPNTGTPGFLDNYAVTRISTLVGVNGSGVLATLRFRGLSPGVSSLTFSNDLLYDSNNTSPQEIAHNTLQGSANVTGVPSSCEVTNLYWNQTSANEGDFVELVVEGTNCVGQNVTFEIFEDDSGIDELVGGSDDDVLVNPAPAVFDATGVATTTWQAEWQDDGFWRTGGDPEYYFVSNVGGVINQSSSTSLLSVALTERKFEIENITLNTGKNSFSLPLTLDNYSIQKVFENINTSVDRIYTYDGGFKVYHFDNKPSNLQDLEVGKGYIIFMKNNTVLSINGSKRESDLTRPIINVKLGWNLIGTFSGLYKASDILRDITYTELYTYNSATGLYDVVNPTDNLNEERSYWIYATSNSSFIPLTGRVIG